MNTDQAIIEPSVLIAPFSGALSGKTVTKTTRRIQDLSDFFDDEAARRRMKPDQILYEVEAYLPVAQGLEGGLFFGRTILYPGCVGQEYFMTKGHLHEKADRGEYYWGLEGEGMLILMDAQRSTWAERMFPGSLHYIPAHVVHRSANIGAIPLIFGACWPSDAGHNYDIVQSEGFSARLMDVDGRPQLIDLPHTGIS